MSAPGNTVRRLRAEQWMRERANCERVQSRMEFNSFDVVDAHIAGARAEAYFAAAKLRHAAGTTRTPFGEQLLKLAAEIEEGA